MVLVVRILNGEYDKGNIHRLRDRLRDMPIELNELFRNILVRDGQDMSKLVLCFQWILYARRPLKREEFYYAVLSLHDPQSLSAWDAEEVTSQDMERFLLNSSKGLAEMTRSKPPTVQFIHESVREFLLKKEALVDIWHVLEGMTTGASHDQLKIGCYRYMCIDISEHLVLPTALLDTSNNEAKKLREIASEKFPFLNYAVNHVLSHADIAEGEGITQNTFIESFPLRNWITLYNLLQKHQTRRYSQEGGLLDFLSGGNHSNLLRAQLSKETTTDLKNEHWSSLFIAFANRSKDAIKTILLPYRSYGLVNKDLQEASAELDQDLNLFFESSRSIKVQSRQNLLSSVAQQGILSVIRLLLGKGVKVNEISKGGTLLSTAAKCSHIALVELLLKEGAGTESKDAIGQTPLSLAARKGREALVELLLDNGAEIDSKDHEGVTPREAAAQIGREKIVKLLDERKAKMT